MGISKKNVMLALGILLFLIPNSTFANAAGTDTDGVWQQSTSVNGVVTDQTGLPIIGANVIEKGTTNGVITNIDGEFTMNIPVGATLEVSYIGYIPETVVVTAATSNLTIVLREDAQALDEVVVVGYGVQKKKLVTGATVQVKGDDLQRMSTTSPLTALQSQSPGINIVQKSGQPGDGFKVNIRGLGTIGDASPLYVIDGVTGGDINNLNPADIESIDVLKDAASAAIYGSRAANGVILVTTKQGKSGKVQVTYDGYYGVQNVYKMPELLDAKQYMEIMNRTETNDGSQLTDFTQVMTPEMYQSIQNGTWKGTNWLEEIRNKNAPTQNHSVGLSGGNETSRFSMGYSYTAQEGILGKPVASDFTRSTVRLNSDHVILRVKDFDAIKIGQTLYYNYTTNSGIAIGNQYGNDISNMLRGYPIMPVYNQNGGYFDNDDKIASGLQNFQADFANPIALMEYANGQNESKNHRLRASAYLQIQPIKNLIFKSQFGYSFSSSSYRSFSPVYKLSSTVLSESSTVEQKAGQGWDWSLENTLNYVFTLAGAHNLDVLVGQSINKWGMGQDMNAKNYNLIWNNFQHAWLTNTQGISSSTTVGGEPWDQGALASFFGRVNYNFNERYMASLVLRADGSSNFARGNRWGYFPSVSAGWVMSEEPFMQSTKNWMDYFKLRASWGQNGNCNIDNFQYLSTVSFDNTAAYSFGNYKNSQSTGGYPNILPNPDISWETSETIDIGFDARFFDSRLNVAFDWYKKSTKDWLIVAPILLTYGTNAPYVNGGDVDNTGVELGLNWRDQIGSDFTYGVGVNFAYNKNEVTRIANAEGVIRGETKVLSEGTSDMYRVEVGQPISYFWGYKTGGVFQNQAEIDAWKAAGNPTLQPNPQPGDLIFLNTNGDDIIDTRDKTKIGDPNPDVTLGINLNFGYKGFDLSVAAYGAFGQQIARSYRKFADSYRDNYTTEVYDYWHGEGTSNRLPRLTSGNNTNFMEISDIYIEDGDYLRLQNITLGYDFKRLMPRLPLGQLRLYVSAQNLFTITGYKGMDPEVGTSTNDEDYGWARGIDVGHYPAPRTFLIGANIKF